MAILNANFNRWSKTIKINYKNISVTQFSHARNNFLLLIKDRSSSYMDFEQHFLTCNESLINLPYLVEYEYLKLVVDISIIKSHLKLHLNTQLQASKSIKS